MNIRASISCCVAALALLLLSLSPAHAAELPGAARADLRFDTLDIRDGLAQNSVQAVAQGPLGMMWLGTDDGLHRYDGYDFTVYRKSHTENRGLQSSSIMALFSDSRGTLWIGTHDGGLHRMDTATGEITPLPSLPSTSNVPEIVWDITEDANGRIWFSGSSGAGYIEPGSDRVNPLVLPEQAAFDTTDIWRVRQDADGRWWALGENVAASFESLHGEWRHLDVRSALGLAPGDDFRVTAAGKDHEGRLVLAVNSHLLVLDADRVAGVIALPRNAATGRKLVPRDILADDGGNLWIATAGNGLLRHSPDGRFSHYQHDPFLDMSLGSDRLTDLFLDRTGLLWVGTTTAGANHFDPATVAFHHFRHHPVRKNSLSSNGVWSFARMPGNGPLWVATDDGLNRFDPITRTVTHYRHDRDNPSSLAPGGTTVLRFDDRGDLWISAGSSLDRYDAAIDGFVHHALPGGEENRIVTFLPLGGTRFLVGTQLSLGVFDTATGDFTPLAVETSTHPALARAYAVAMARGVDGTFWIGTNLGLLAWDGRSPLAVDVMQGAWQSLYDTDVQDISVRADGSLALATASGLALAGSTPGSPVTWWTTAHGLPAGTLYAVREDPAGKLWISSNSGLLRIDPRSGEIDHFDRHDGLQSEEFNGGAALADERGRLYFGGINGFNIFDPLELDTRTTPPQVAITRVSGFGGSSVPALQDDYHIALDWRQNSITFDFMAIDFTAPRSNQFQFRLLPLHEEWLLVEDDHRASYADLSGGHYVFEVRAATRRGEWSEPARVSLDVATKPWRTWWAWLLYSVVVLALLAAILRHQAQKLAAQQTADYEARQRERVQSWHELGTSLARTLDVTEIFALLYKHVARSVNAEFIALFEEHDGRIVLARCHGAGPAERAELRAFAARQGAFIERLERTMWMRALPAAELYPGSDDTLHGMQLIVVPARDNAARFRFLLAGRQGGPFADEDVSRVAGYVTQTLIAIDKARLFADVQALATKDALTGLANRRHLFERADLEFQRCVRYGRPFAVLMIDFDHFKSINDCHGHDVGDRVLRMAGHLFAHQLRKFDVVARYGGEEFVMCLPETTLAQARIVAERVREQVEGLRIPLRDGHLQVTVSIGAAAEEPASGDLQDVLRAADSALYAAKAGGRNRVRATEPATD